MEFINSLTKGKGPVKDSLIYFTLTLTLLLSSHVYGEPCSLSFLGAAYKEKQYSKINECFNQSSFRSVHWLFLLTLQQKSLYQIKDWDRFFGISLFIRRKYFTDHQLDLKAQDQAIALETLGLIRLCHNGEARQLMTEFLQKNKVLSDSYLIKVKTFLELNGIPPTTSSSPQPPRSDPTWVINKTQFERLTHPKNLKRKIKNLCTQDQSQASGDVNA